MRKLGRTTSHRLAMLRNMVTSLILHERIVTTLPKAKELQRLADKVITMSKKSDPIHARRECNKIVRTADAQTKLMTILGPRYRFRQGGYTRILQLAKPRAGDKAPMAVIEYVDRPGEVRAARPPTQFQQELLKVAIDTKDQTPDASTESLQQVFERLGVEYQDEVSLDDEAKDDKVEPSEKKE